MIKGYRNAQNGTYMEDVKVLDITESPTVGRWVLASIGGYDDSVTYELTFAPTLGPADWQAINRRLPLRYRIRELRAVSGELLGRKRALMALIT